MTEPICTCTELQRLTVCHDIRTEPLRLPDNTHWYDEGGVILPGPTRVRNDSGEDEPVIPA